MPSPDPTTPVLSILARMKWFRECDLQPTGWTAPRPVFSYTLSHRHPYPRVKCVVGPMWVTYYRLVGETIYDMDSVRTEDVGTVERVLSDLIKTAAPVR